MQIRFLILPKRAFFPWQHVKYDDKTTNFTLQPILRLSILRLSTFQFRPISLCILEIDHFTIQTILRFSHFTIQEF